MADYAATKFVDETDFDEAPVVEAEAEAKGSAAIDDCALELLGT